MTTNAKKLFDESMKNIHDLEAIYDYLDAMHCSVNQDAILRAHYVLSVSAMDTYFHTLIIDEMMNRYRQSDFDYFQNIEVKLSDLLSLIKSDISDQDKEQAILVALRKRLSKDSFQAPKSIEHALGLIRIKNVWGKITKMNNIALISNVPAEDIKKKLSIIILRRNKIAHESDFDCISMSFIPIRKEDVNDTISFLSAFVEAIDVLVCGGNR